MAADIFAHDLHTEETFTGCCDVLLFTVLLESLELPPIAFFSPKSFSTDDTKTLGDDVFWNVILQRQTRCVLAALDAGIDLPRQAPDFPRVRARHSPLFHSARTQSKPDSSVRRICCQSPCFVQCHLDGCVKYCNTSSPWLFRPNAGSK